MNKQTKNAIKKRVVVILSLITAIMLMCSPAYASNYLATASGLTAAEYETLMPEALKGYGGTIYDMEQKYEINGTFLLSVIILESGHGTSGLAQENKNVAGNKATDGWKAFGTITEGIEYAAENLATNYLKEDGKYYRGDTVKDISTLYCEQSESWAQQIEDMMYMIQMKGLKDREGGHK